MPGAKSRRDSKCVSMQTVTDQVVPHFHNEPGVAVIEIGAKTFMCIGALPPQDHPHVFCDMGNDLEYVCPYCSTLYRHNPALAPNQARPTECELHGTTARACASMRSGWSADVLFGRRPLRVTARTWR